MFSLKTLSSSLTSKAVNMHTREIIQYLLTFFVDFSLAYAERHFFCCILNIFVALCTGLSKDFLSYFFGYLYTLQLPTVDNSFNLYIHDSMSINISICLHIYAKNNQLMIIKWVSLFSWINLEYVIRIENCLFVKGKLNSSH